MVEPSKKDEQVLYNLLHSSEIRGPVDPAQLKRVAELAKNKFKKEELDLFQVSHLKKIFTMAAKKDSSINDVAKDVLQIPTDSFDNALLTRFYARAPLTDIFPSDRRLTLSEIKTVKRVVKLAKKKELNTTQLQNLEQKMRTLASKDYRVEQAYNDVVALGKSFGKSDTESAFIDFMKSYVPLSKQLLALAHTLKVEFQRYFQKPDHAWTLQKYDIAADELYAALQEKKHEPTDNKHEQAIWHALSKPEMYKNGHERYNHMMVHLRMGLEEAPNSEFLKNVCNARFTQVNMHVFCESMVENMIAAGITSPPEDQKNPKWLEGLSVSKQLEHMGKKSRNLFTEFSVQLGKLKGTFGVLFDPHIQSNVPYKQLDFTVGSNNVQLLAMGTPTIQTGVSKVVVNPEFRNFIENQPEGKCHLYVNLQNNAPKGLIGDESARVRALEAFSKEKEHFGKFKMVTLAQDSKFYKQEGESEQALGSFMHTFISHMRSGNEGYSFPDGLPDGLEDNLKRYCKAVFGGTDETILFPKQKRDFIELAYPVIIHHLLEQHKSTSLNITCKDGIDRGGKLQGLFVQYLSMGEDMHNTPERKKLLAAISLSRAPIVKAQPMIGSRKERYLSALKTMDDKAQRHVLKDYWSVMPSKTSITAPERRKGQRALV